MQQRGSTRKSKTGRPRPGATGPAADAAERAGIHFPARDKLKRTGSPRSLGGVGHEDALKLGRKLVEEYAATGEHQEE